MPAAPDAEYPVGGPDPGSWPGGLPHNRAYILPAHKIMFISVAKNACTSLKWMLAGLSGQDVKRFHAANAMQSDIAHTIHRRQLWEGVPRLGDLAEHERAEIRSDNGWFVFGVVRDPRVRLFSAWQSKLLNRDPGYLRYRDEPFYPRLPTRTEDVVEDFAAFVDYLASGPDHKIATKDVHFRSQSAMLATPFIDYSRIYDVRELGALVHDLTEHLRGLGIDSPVVLPRENSTPLGAHQVLFADGVREKIEQLYAADFEEFGHLWPFDRISADPPDWPKPVFAGFAATAAAYEQIHSLSLQRRRLEKRLERVTEERRRLQHRVEELEAEAVGQAGPTEAAGLSGLARRLRGRH